LAIENDIADEAAPDQLDPSPKNDVRITSGNPSKAAIKNI